MASLTAALIDRSSSAITNTSTQVAAANTGRNYLLIHNPSAVDMTVRFGAAAVHGGAGGIKLASGGSTLIFEGDGFVPSQTVNVISASGSSLVVTCLEG